MCGVAGEFSCRSSIDEVLADKVLGSLNHRGPDARGKQTIQHDEKHYLHLFHTRLSIIDLSQDANQPLKIGTHCLVFNGELYNYLELRQTLSAKGVVFKTRSDTEVFAHMLIHYGIDGLRECEGMWSFAFYNGEKKELLIGRDRVGEKPLFFHYDQKGVVFASEIPAIKMLTDKSLRPNESLLKRYLFLGYRSVFKSNESYFQDVFQVLPGTVIRFSETPQNPKVIEYWKPKLSTNFELTRESAIKQTRELLLTTLEKSLRSDVPLAFSLSGGIDSTVLVSLARRELNKDIHAFTVANTGSEYDEKSMVKNTVKTLGIDHSWVDVDFNHFLPNLENLVKMHQAPIGTVTFYVQWKLMQLVHENGYKVTISGTGADELFSGYYDHYLAYIDDLKKNRSERLLGCISDWERATQPLIRNPKFRDPYFLSTISDPGVYLYDFADHKQYLVDSSWEEKFYQEDYCKETLRNRMMNELCHESVPLILAEDDLNSMSFSIENRSPYLNHKIMDFAHTIPSEFLIEDGIAKSILRDAGRGIAPDEVMNKVEKVGFNASLRSLIDLTDEGTVQFLLKDSPVFDIVNRETIKEITEDPEKGFAQPKFLFAFINVKMFLENFS